MKGWKKLGEGAFFRCESLKRIKIPSSVRKFGNELFYDCINLQEIYFEDRGSCGNFMGPNRNDYKLCLNYPIKIYLKINGQYVDVLQNLKNKNVGSSSNNISNDDNINKKLNEKKLFIINKNPQNKDIMKIAKTQLQEMVCKCAVKVLNEAINEAYDGTMQSMLRTETENKKRNKFYYDNI